MSTWIHQHADGSFQQSNDHQLCILQSTTLLVPPEENEIHNQCGRWWYECACWIHPQGMERSTPSQCPSQYRLCTEFQHKSYRAEIQHRNFRSAKTRPSNPYEASITALLAYSIWKTLPSGEYVAAEISYYGNYGLLAKNILQNRSFRYPIYMIRSIACKNDY